MERYIKHWTKGGYAPESAFFSQALIQLNTTYCEDGRCGSCPMGVRQMSEIIAGAGNSKLVIVSEVEGSTTLCK